VKTLTDALIVALMIFIPVAVAACIDHELSEPESARVCSCDPHLEAYLKFTGQSFSQKERSGDRVIGVVGDDYRNKQGDFAKSSAK